MLEQNKFTLYLIRHGQSEVNVKADQMGQDPETPLTELGRSQAAQLGAALTKRHIRFDQIFSSDYTRALDTAKITTQSYYMPQLTITPELREYDAGDWKGSLRQEILTPEVRLRMGSLNQFFLPPNGESLNQVSRRASRWLEDVILYNPHVIKHTELRGKDNPYQIGVFSHGMTIKCLLQHILGFDKGMTWKIDIWNTSVTTLSFGEEGWRLHGINDTSHLQ